jgi:hypothetical protein
VVKSDLFCSSYCHVAALRHSAAAISITLTTFACVWPISYSFLPGCDARKSRWPTAS